MRLCHGPEIFTIIRWHLFSWLGANSFSQTDKKNPLLYHCYLDNIFGLWDGSESEFLTFLHTLNPHHPKIKLKHNLNAQLNGHTVTPAKHWQPKYILKTSRHVNLHKSSFHPKHTYRGLIKSQLICFHRICTFMEHMEESTFTQNYKNMTVPAVPMVLTL